MQRLRQAISGTVALAALLLLGACASSADREESLYRQMGGEPGIAAVVNALIQELAADERIRHHFRSIHIAGFRDRLETHFCQVSGGDCNFDGRSMRESHRRLGISSADFNALVEDLMRAMDRVGLEHAVQNAFLARLAPMQRAIVSDPADAPD